MDIEKPGEFDGLTITMNPAHPAEPRSYYLAHAFGSTVQWSLDTPRAKRMFGNLREATARGESDPAALDEAVRHYRRFEETSSEYAVWLLDSIGHHWTVKRYTSFFRADIEAMTLFHRTGHAPRWAEFYSQWTRLAASHEVWIKPFTPRPFPSFTPVAIPTQEVLQAS
jgi:hypothetical protein